MIWISIIRSFLWKRRSCSTRCIEPRRTQAWLEDTSGNRQRNEGKHDAENDPNRNLLIDELFKTCRWLKRSRMVSRRPGAHQRRSSATLAIRGLSAKLQPSWRLTGRQLIPQPDLRSCSSEHKPSWVVTTLFWWWWWLVLFIRSRSHSTLRLTTGDRTLRRFLPSFWDDTLASNYNRQHVNSKALSIKRGTETRDHVQLNQLL